MAPREMQSDTVPATVYVDRPAWDHLIQLSVLRPRVSASAIVSTLIDAFMELDEAGQMAVVERARAKRAERRSRQG